MGKLLKEAAIDDRFNVQMNRIQQAIIALEKLTDELVQAGPVGSQRTALQAAASDLKRLYAALFDGRSKK